MSPGRSASCSTRSAASRQGGNARGIHGRGTAVPFPRICVSWRGRRAGGNGMTMAVHFGVTVPQISRTWEESKAAAQEFERLGFDSLWVCDHLYGVPRPDIPILEAWTLLTA